MSDVIQLTSMCNRNAVPVLNQPQLIYVLTELFPAPGMSNVRMPLNFTLVLDRSGSMAGEKLQNLKQAVKHIPELIILNMEMPDLDGIEVMEKLKDDKRTKDIPVILLTDVDPTIAMMKRLNETPPAYYLIKSNIELSQLVEKSLELLDK